MKLEWASGKEARSQAERERYFQPLPPSYSTRSFAHMQHALLSGGACLRRGDEVVWWEEGR